MILEVSDLHFSYGSNPILKGIDLQLDEAEIACVVGPNGSGKSTLVKCINSLLRPKRGRVFVDGTRISSLSTMEIARNIGYVAQSSNMLYSATVFDTVMMGRRPHASAGTRERDIEIVMDILFQLDLGSIALREFNQLSGGQQQRVLIARAIAQTPRVLLLDEPTSALDIAHQLEVMEILHELIHAQQMAVLMVVHDLNLASRFADKIIMLSDGQIHSSGAAEETITRDNLRLVYGVDTSIHDVNGKRFVVPLTRVGLDER